MPEAVTFQVRDVYFIPMRLRALCSDVVVTVGGPRILTRPHLPD
jgi:hypothetical protein